MEIENRGDGVYKSEVSIVSAKDRTGADARGIPLPLKLDPIHGTGNSVGSSRGAPEVINFIGIPSGTNTKHFYLHGEKKHVEVFNGNSHWDWRETIWFEIRVLTLDPLHPDKKLSESSTWIRVEPHDDQKYPYYDVAIETPPFLKGS